MITIANYIYIFSRTYSHITVQLESVLEIFHLLFVSESALVNRVTIGSGTFLGTVRANGVASSLRDM